MKTAIYPGSFDPWHKGHTDVLLKTLCVFDKVIVALGNNPNKKEVEINERFLQQIIWDNLPSYIKFNQVEVIRFDGLLVDFVKQYKNSAIVRGLRNSHDFEYEKNQQMWNEDLGLEIPIFYVIANRNLVHISSSTIKALKRIENEKN